MKTFLIIAGTAVITVILVVGGAKITARHWGGHHDAYYQDGPRMLGHGFHGQGRHGFRHRGHGHGVMMGAGAGCTGDRLDRIEAVVENFVTFTPAQAEAWKTLSAAMRDAQAQKRTVCEARRAEMRAAMEDDEDEKDEARSAPAPLTERLARMETRLETGLAALQKLRPALDAFYATLDDGQRKALDDMMGGHHRFRRHAGMWR